MRNLIIIKVASLLIALLFAVIAHGQTWTPKTGKAAKTASAQCWGTTKKGERCKMKGQPGKDGKHWCRFHNSQK